MREPQREKERERVREREKGREGERERRRETIFYYCVFVYLPVCKQNNSFFFTTYLCP